MIVTAQSNVKVCHHRTLDGFRNKTLYLKEKFTDRKKVVGRVREEERETGRP